MLFRRRGRKTARLTGTLGEASNRSRSSPALPCARRWGSIVLRNLRAGLRTVVRCGWADEGRGGSRRYREDRSQFATRCHAVTLPRRRGPSPQSPDPLWSKGSVFGTAGLRQRECSAPALRTELSVPCRENLCPCSHPAGASPPGTARSRRPSPASPSLLISGKRGRKTFDNWTFLA